MNEQPSKGNNTNKLLLIVLIASLGFNAWLYSSKTDMAESHRLEKEGLITANLDIEKELNDTYTELNQYKGINSRLDSLLLEANSKVDEQKSRIAQLMKNEKNSSKLNKQLLAEMQELKKMRDEYLERIDALLVENETLKKEKNELSGTVETLTKNLESTVTTASILKSEYLVVKSYKKRSNDKFTTTAMAKRTNKIESCFTVLENNIAKTGEKTVYMRIIEPGGKIVGNRTEGSNSFKKVDTNEDLLFTTSKTIEYKNEKESICIDWTEEDRVFTSGTYMIEIYIDGYLSAVNSMTLR
jgi:hypothetical protein